MELPELVRRQAAGEAIDRKAALRAARRYFRSHPKVRQFLRARALYEDTMELLRQKRLTPEEATARLDRLRVTDAAGQVWTIGARSAAWYVWRAGRWCAARPAFIRDALAAPQPPKPARKPPASSLRLCGRCGAEMGGQAKFCAHCGAKL